MARRLVTISEILRIIGTVAVRRGRVPVSRLNFSSARANSTTGLFEIILSDIFVQSLPDHSNQLLIRLCPVQAIVHHLSIVLPTSQHIPRRRLSFNCGEAARNRTKSYVPLQQF